MRKFTEVLFEMRDIKDNLASISDGTQDILKGWVEALEWVLEISEKKGKA